MRYPLLELELQYSTITSPFYPNNAGLHQYHFGNVMAENFFFLNEAPRDLVLITGEWNRQSACSLHLLECACEDLQRTLDMRSKRGLAVLHRHVLSQNMIVPTADIMQDCRDLGRFRSQGTRPACTVTEHAPEPKASSCDNDPATSASAGVKIIRGRRVKSEITIVTDSDIDILICVFLILMCGFSSPLH